MNLTGSLATTYFAEEMREVMRDPEWMTVFAEAIGKLQDGFFDEAYQSTIFQQWEGRSNLGIEDVYPFVLLHSMIQTGDIAHTKLRVYEEPLADKKVEENNRTLAAALVSLSPRKDDSGNLLDCKWSGEFWGGQDGADGFVEWKGIAKFEVTDDGKSGGFLYFPSGRLPLEVGTTSAAKTYLQLMNGGVARWPYHQKEITIYKLVRDAGPSYGNEQRNDSTLPGEKL